jgi:LmbE family N-acetylglucosaminyl deacetylase
MMRSLPIAIALLLPASCGVAAERWDLVVVAPHSDDEAIGCTGVMLRALERKKRVGVVVLTAGDGHVKAAAAAAKKEAEQLIPQDFVDLAALRQRHTLEAMTQLGLRAEDLLFLGYPDGGLAAIYTAEDDAPYRQPHTGRSETYGPVVRDYHFQAHGQSAPYVRQAVIDDLTEIFKARRPQEIYTTNEVDAHPDHRATSWFVRNAAAAAGLEGPLFTYVVHGKPPPEPPRLRLFLTAAELQRKRATIEIYQSGVSPVHDDLAEHYALPEELFWAIRPDGVKP